jgi:zinc/manganese transport system substrate-binding protein
MRSIRLLSALVALVAGAALATSAVPAGPATAAPAPRVLNVVAAENFWGSLAAQLGGRLVRVTSIVTDPNADPHEYESSPADARLFAQADLVIVNGAGYDTWADKLLAASPRAGRQVLDVATFLHRPAGANPHLWYDPADVSSVIDKITSLYRSIEPGARGFFAARHRSVESALSGYRDRLATLKKRYAGTAVGATESIFVDLAGALHLKLITPKAFMDAVSEGVDPPISSLVTFERQISARRIKVLVYNVQTVTPLTATIRAKARARHIPVVGISETMVPPNSTFQRWMVGQLNRLAAALAEARS